MTEESENIGEPRFYFTEPWEPLIVRRGDALGLRALTDQFADAVAPDLSNRVGDGRWVTILAWCLARSQEVFYAAGERSVATRAQQRKRYAWLRPLELMWVARTIALVDDWKKRPLPGQRCVRPWYEDDKMKPDHFGMSSDQFRAYRQTGVYGGYRLVFRKWPGMTVYGDGWTPGPGTIQLAKWLDGKLGAARPEWQLDGGDDEKNIGFARSANLGQDNEYQWWLRQWKMFDQTGRNADENTLPRPKLDYSLLPEAEWLKSLMFGNDPSGKRRLAVTSAAAKTKADSHSELCEYLGSVFTDDQTIVLLPRFSRLADAGMDAMDLVAETLQDKSRVPLAEAVAHPDANEVCGELLAAAREWLERPEMNIRHIETANRFAGAITNAEPAECLAGLLQYHEQYGGGLRWFVLRDDHIEPRTPQRRGSSRYRFRLWSLCRLAAQCGAIGTMPQALLTDDELGEDDE